MAATIASAVFDHWISISGIPLYIAADQGRQFEDDLLVQLKRFVGAKQVNRIPYYPQANGIVERMHRTLKAVLKCSSESP